MQSPSVPGGICVGIPAYNEAGNIGVIFRSLLADDAVGKIFVVDDASTDCTREIIEKFSRQDARVILLSNARREGQLYGWRRIAEAATSEILVFVDADTVPDSGAPAILVKACKGSAMVSGRFIPECPDVPTAAAFSARLLHQLRSMQIVQLAVIGRLCAVDRRWFLEVADRNDIVASDCYLACVAAESGKGVKYIAEAVVRYIPPRSHQDFAAQRQRADMGYEQLRALGVLKPEYEARFMQIVYAIWTQSLLHPTEFVAWIVAQLRARFSRVYQPLAQAHPGIWEPQLTTKV